MRGKITVDINVHPNLTRSALRYAKREIRRAVAKKGWPNWYINRGRMSLNPTKKELRAVSWRRAK